MAHLQGFGAGWESKGSPDWAETPPLRSRIDVRPPVKKKQTKKKNKTCKAIGKIKTKEKKERKEGRDSRVSGVRVDGKHVFKDDEEMTDSLEIIMLAET